MTGTELQERLAALAPAPGVYLMKNARGEVIYVGKAASLRSRVRSYFGSRRGMDGKTRELVEHIADFEVIRTDTPTEALILENELIKRYQPKYNVMLRDDKTYPYIRITNEPFPRVISTRRLVNDGSRYFGPYTSASSVHRTLDLLKRLFPYRPCDIEITGNAPRPCLYYHIGRCVGPCIGAVDQAQYAQVIDKVVLFLEGRAEELLPSMEAEMEAAAEALDFERAARIRDDIRAIKHVLEQQKIVSGTARNFDVLAVAQGPGGDAAVQVATIRNGKMLGSEYFMLRGARIDDSPSQLLSSFVTQFYQDAAMVPPELVLQHPLEDEALVREWLRERRGGAVKLTVPKRGERRQLVEMVAKSAQENLEQDRVRWLNDEQRMTAAMTELADALGLEKMPRRIECFDISTLQGTNSVASMVVFEDGKPKKSDYRRFSIKGVAGQNDFAMMQEVIRRRFKRAAREDVTEEWRTLPDLVIVDGGKGQLNAALEVLRELDVTVPIVGLAKENEELFLPGRRDPIVLPRDAQALFLVQRVRDEAHRFAVTFHRKRRTKSTFRSALDGLKGVGPARRKALLKTFGSVARIRQASVEELAAVPGIGPRLAEQIKEELGA
ncbi:excinuclease ABC subunit UvrC [Sphaerobacter sp.]|uniref:excinuclease ABC subunit UvrC n=1 Tax=Sphaerobacter sp. TaxID=2099654 RepID=UPI001D91BC17|nr:excinuclease ABC subunit UvrC [Sphaerobacter sp.]MBX5445936.1 excinuclease ABC subunit UvrC [Sphaerobacter sp.]